jgi:hypothetical protein
MDDAIRRGLPRSAWVALVLLLLFRVVTYALTDFSDSGDGVSYLKNASFIGENGILPPLSIQPNAYGWLLSWFHVHEDSASALQRIGRAQQWLDFSVVILLCWLAQAFLGKSSKLLLPAWILIVLQPFTGIWSRTVYSEQAVTFFSFIGFLVFSIFTYNRQHRRVAQFGMFLAGLALGFASILRSDVLALNTLLLVGLVVYLAFFAGDWLLWRRSKIVAVLLAYIAVPLMMSSYQYASSGEFGIFNNNRTHEGYFAWVRTWPATPKEYAVFAFFSGRDSWSADKYPGKAFGSQEEKQAFSKIMEEWKQLHLVPSPAIDAKFRAMAEAKIRQNPIKYYVFNPLQRIYFFWVNNDGSQFYTLPFKLQRPVSTIVVVLIGLSRLMLIALFLAAVLGFWLKLKQNNWSFQPQNWLYFFSVIACLYVILRTLELGVLSAFMIAGLMEIRFISIVMPFFLVGSLSGVRILANKLCPN